VPLFCASSSFDFGEQPVEFVFDVADELLLEWFQQETEVNLELDSRIANMHLAMQTRAINPQRVTVPLAVSCTRVLATAIGTENGLIRSMSAISPLWQFPSGQDRARHGSRPI